MKLNLAARSTNAVAPAASSFTDVGPVDIEVPRGREGSYEPLVAGEQERRFTGFDQKIIAMYACGVAMREIQGYLADMCGTEVAIDFISRSPTR